jgi:preprotein translocase subunit SecG
MGFLYTLAIFLFLFLCLILCLIVLVQEGKGGGLGASFGGGDSSDSLFGTSTPEILKKITAWFGVAFVVSCIILSFWTASLGRHHIASSPASIEAPSE